MLWFVLLLSLLLSSCSKILLPYEERKLCEKGPGYGVCGSLWDVYHDSIKNPERYMR